MVQQLIHEFYYDRQSRKCLSLSTIAIVVRFIQRFGLKMGCGIPFRFSAQGHYLLRVCSLENLMADTISTWRSSVNSAFYKALHRFLASCEWIINCDHCETQIYPSFFGLGGMKPRWLWGHIHSGVRMNALVIGTTFYLPNIALCQTKVAVDILDRATGDQVSARVEYTQPAGRGPKPRRSLSAGRFTLFEPGLVLSPTPGVYEFTVRRGPEFQDVKAGFTLERNALDSIEVVVPHKTPMRLFGWYSGDLQTTLQAEDLRRWMAAESLDMAATTAVGVAFEAGVRSKDKSHVSSVGSIDTLNRPAITARPKSVPVNARGEPDWTKTPSPDPLLYVVANTKQISTPENGGVVLHRYREFTDSLSIEASGAHKTLESVIVNTYDLLDRLPDESIVHVEITRPWERQVPMVLATNKIDSVQLLSEHLKPDSALALSASIRNPDTLRFKGKKGLGRLVEYIYWQMLEAGFRIPLTAGSGFTAKGDTVLGYNRVYAFLDESMPRVPDTWWSQVRQGATIVTNGPLIVPTVNGLPPGSVQVGYRDQPIALDIELDLTVRDPVEYLEVVFNGRSLYQARLEDHARQGAFPALQISESGWLILRVVTEHEQSYRMTTTSPYYFEFEEARVSRKAVQFFKEWFDETALAIRQDSSTLDLYEKPLEFTSNFWTTRLAQSTAE